MILSNMPANSTPFGMKLAAIRKQASLTQTQLAEMAGLSQTQVSRLESDGRLQRIPQGLLKLLCDALAMPLEKLVEGTPLSRALDTMVDEDPGGYTAYCPNPLCPRNRVFEMGRDYGFEVQWKSLESVSQGEFFELEYCGRCGTRLIRACSHCGKRIRRVPEWFCSRCGRQMHDFPEAQRLALEKQFGPCRDALPPPMDRRAGGAAPSELDAQDAPADQDAPQGQQAPAGPNPRRTRAGRPRRPRRGQTIEKPVTRS